MEITLHLHNFEVISGQLGAAGVNLYASHSFCNLVSGRCLQAIKIAFLN